MSVFLNDTYVLKVVRESLSRVEVGGKLIPIRDLSLNEETGIVTSGKDERNPKEILTANCQINQVDENEPIRIKLKSEVMFASELFLLAQEIELALSGREIRIELA